MPDFDFILHFDPGPYPLVSGLRLSILEVSWGLKLGSFNPGTLLFDQARGSLHRVQQVDGRQCLEPACERITVSGAAQPSGCPARLGRMEEAD